MVEADVTVAAVVERALLAIRSAAHPPLSELRAMAALLQESSDARAACLQPSAFAFLPELVLSFLERHAPLVEGAGIAYSPGAFADRPAWLDWWRRRGHGRPEYVTYDLNPRSISYYDYASREWFLAPQVLGLPVAIGPYVDAGGGFVSTARLVISVPTASGTHTLGCDLSLAHLESLFVHAAAAIEPPLALIGSGGRILASNSARHSGGTRASDAWPTWPVFTRDDGLASAWTVGVPREESNRPACGSDQAGRRAMRRKTSCVVSGVSGTAESAT